MTAKAAASQSTHGWLPRPSTLRTENGNVASERLFGALGGGRLRRHSSPGIRVAPVAAC